MRGVGSRHAIGSRECFTSGLHSAVVKGKKTAGIFQNVILSRAPIRKGEVGSKKKVSAELKGRPSRNPGVNGFTASWLAGKQLDGTRVLHIFHWNEIYTQVVPRLWVSSLDGRRLDGTAWVTSKSCLLESGPAVISSVGDSLEGPCFIL